MLTPSYNDYIELSDIVATAYLGISDNERSIKQEISLNIRFNTNLNKAGNSDNIKDTINYADVVEIIFQELNKVRFKLIESLAEYLVELLRTIYSPNSIEIEIFKINPPLKHYSDSKVKIHLYRKFIKEIKFDE
jgi:FolB domain-containing protein|tara:strand:+ start:200 stop:601 length:402 start_codon:yes stop_codon:yes gene_type:complete